MGRIVTNPPWIVVNDTPKGDRKIRLSLLQKHLKVQTKPLGASSKGDLACLFTARSTELYLKVGGRIGMVLPGTALTGQTWEKWRSGEWGPGVIMKIERGLDLSNHNPTPFSHAPNGTSVVYAQRDARLARALPKRGPSRPWTPSDYLNRVRRGACAQPHGLLYVEVQNVSSTDNEGVVKIRTKRSTKANWRDLSMEDLIERAALLPVVTSKDVQPFVYKSSRFIIAPTRIEPDGRRSLRWHGLVPEEDNKFPNTIKYWQRADDQFALKRAETAGKTLLENLDWKRTLSSQLEIMTGEGKPVKVVVNKSGKSGLKSVRIPLEYIADDMLYYITCQSEDEALYLCAIINAPAMQQTWNETKTSIMHYDKNPWKKIPIKRYDSRNHVHQRLVQLAKKAEENFDDAIKRRLNIDVARILPEFVGNV